MAAAERSGETLSRVTRPFVYVVSAAGAAVIFSVVSELPASPPIQWVLLLVLTALSETFAIKLPALRARLSVSESFIFTSIFLFGTAPSVLLVVIDGLLVPLWQRRRQKVHQLLFNTFEPVLSVWIASETFFRVSGLEPLSSVPAEVTAFVAPALLVPVLYFLTNSFLTAIVMALETGGSPFLIWRRHFVWLSFNYFVAASIAGLLVQNPRFFLSSFAMSAPLLVVSYVVFRASIGRTEDAQRHLDDLRRLYLSTIEAFAIAVDAKDQVTHRHIRRVQQSALRLAAALGVRDEPTLRAIEAAGLLHDIGKLAIPDHLLNKPGKLTSTEFEHMKLHAQAGAEILSAIDFPFPVVPIVRHHHENWDGTGYPAGVAGDAIPIGARILAVVDCFDALTSDRPYRRALTAEQAIEILRQHRGTMYDPHVVDVFARHYVDIVTVDLVPAARPHVVANIARLRRTAALAGAEDGGRMTMLENDGSNSETHVATDLAERAAQALHAYLPLSMIAIYAYVPVQDEVVLVYQKGGAASFAGCRLPLGRTVTGWVAANRRTLANADPSLDLGAISAAGCERMRSCLAIPLTSGDRLVGVLTLYSDTDQAFDAAACRVTESFGPILGAWLAQEAAIASPPTAITTSTRTAPAPEGFGSRKPTMVRLH